MTNLKGNCLEVKFLVINDLRQNSDEDAWSTDKTAKDLGISSGSVRQAIQIAKAIGKTIRMRAAGKE